MCQKTNMSLHRIVFLLFLSRISAIEIPSLPIPEAVLTDSDGNPLNLEGFYSHLHKIQLKDSGFPCKTYPIPKRNMTVHTLTPMDVSVVGGIGDSITAGFGVSAKRMSLMRDDRGMSFSSGGDGTIEDIVTMPNILKTYNPDLKGFAVGFGFETEENAHFNVAQTSATSITAPKQAKELIKRMKYGYGNVSIDFENDWKIISVFIGANDLCGFCLKPAEYNVGNYFTYMREALDLLHKEVPRAFVNMIQLGSLLEYQLMENINKCNLVHNLMCPCMHDAVTKEARDAMRQRTKQFQEVLRNLIGTGRYDTRDDFTVVIQPFLERSHFRKTPEGKIDFTYFALDCFHLSKKGQEMGAKSLWMNMLQPVGLKSSNMPSGFLCPSPESPYFPTRLNSDTKGMTTAGYEEITTQEPEKTTKKTKTQPQSSFQPVSIISIALGSLVCISIVLMIFYKTYYRKRGAESRALLYDRS